MTYASYKEKKEPNHIPVLLREVLDFLNPKEDGVYIDATLGLGGHTMGILEACSGRCKVIGMDMDCDAIEIASNRLKHFRKNITYVNKNFIYIDSVVSELGTDKIDGIIADIGISSYQLESSGRGFSFLRNEPLDMRMDPGAQFTAFDLVNELSYEELANLIYKLGEEKFSRKIAKTIIRHRKEKPIRTSAELAAIVSNAIPKKFHPKRIHPATKTFQALRIAVNNELENLEVFINKAVKILKPGGRLVIISFHSLEDRIVKRTFKKLGAGCTCPPDLPECICGNKSILKILTKQPITPTKHELEQNPRARSSKMRVGEKI